MELNKTLQKINQLMKERNWTFYQLAKESGIPCSSLYSLFHKNNQPTLSTLEKICAGFHISMSEFFSGDPPYRVESYRFTNDERMILELYQTLNPYDKKLAAAYLMGLCKKR